MTPAANPNVRFIIRWFSFFKNITSIAPSAVTDQVPMVAISAMSITIPAMAAGTTYSITIENNTPGHNYEAYQILSGDLHGKILSNVVWANGQTTYTVGTDATEVASNLKTEEDAEALAKSLTLGTVTKSTNTLTDGKYVISGLAPGYYLIKDADNSLGDNKDDAYTDFIVKIVADTTARPKIALPTIDKVVQDETGDKDTTADEYGWGETADHSFNESFDYKLIANFPADNNLEPYTSYKLAFHDTLTNGITFEAIKSVQVITADGTVTDIAVKSDTNPNGYEYTSIPKENPTDDTKFQITIADLLKTITNLKGAKVEVIYSAHLNKDAGIGAEGANSSKAYLEYSNNPNNAANTGTTTEDIVWVYTLMMDNTKVDGETKAPLAGAGFRLYDTATDVEIPVVYDASINAYRPLDPDNGETKEDNAVEMFSAENTGKFDIKGLDAGSYTLKETTVPGGYNKCKDVQIVMSAVHSDNPMDITKANCTITKSMNGAFTNTFQIENNKGSVLPETGGMGTVLFYVVGGILVAGAVIVLITRRRMADEK